MNYLKSIAKVVYEKFHVNRQNRMAVKNSIKNNATFLNREYLSEIDVVDMLSVLLKGKSPERKQLLLQEVMFSRAQLMQDIFVISELGAQRDSGFFVEFGAADGVALSNSWLLENRLGWRGILAEPAQCWHEKLKINRQCIIDTDCVWSRSNECLNFDQVKNPEFSTITDFSTADSHSQVRSNYCRYQVSTVSLLDLMVRHHAPDRPDYLSIDTEGSEFEILSSFNFERFPFKIITCEHNFTPQRKKIYHLLKSKGYRRIHEQLSRYDDWYVRS